MHNISIKLSVLFFLSIGSLLTALIIFPRDVSATGKSYYVSIKGNDDNDGLSLD